MACLLIQQNLSLIVKQIAEVMIKAACTVRLADARNENAENGVDMASHNACFKWR
jgi:hypothetical protein